MHVLHNRLLAPGMEFAVGCGNHVETTAAAGYLEQVNGPVELLDSDDAESLNSAALRRRPNGAKCST
jgi:hypothetical protein